MRRQKKRRIPGQARDDGYSALTKYSPSGGALSPNAVRSRADVRAAGKAEPGSDPDDDSPFPMMPAPQDIPVLVAGAANAAISMVFRPFGWATWSGRSVPVRWTTPQEEQP